MNPEVRGTTRTRRRRLSQSRYQSRRNRRHLGPSELAGQYKLDKELRAAVRAKFEAVDRRIDNRKVLRDIYCSNGLVSRLLG